jgi:transposase
LVWIRLHPEIELIEWPPYSPDLTPIENLWAVLVRQWKAVNLKTKSNMVATVKERWDELRGDNLCHNLVSSMQRRLQAVINANGAYTKY